MGEKFYKQTTLPALKEQGDKAPPIPEKIGTYKIETLLTKGGMSLLYLGFDPQSREPRVIKVLSPEYLNHPEMVDHFLWEAKIIALANHPNIVKLYDYGKWEGGLYIAMEFIRGVSLRQFLMQQSFSLKRSLEIILQVAYALCHLHTHGVIHRDLKPENILIAEDGEVKVIDFGIAQLHEEEPRLTQKVVGTPSYMSPEQKESASNVTFASDIFSLGVIAYELILGKLSYGMINLSLLPSGLQKILGKALAISPEERYTDTVELITALTDYIRSPEIEKERPTTDQATELIEHFEKAEQKLSAQKSPTWPQFAIGLAKDKPAHQLGHYLDFFHFSNNTMALVLAHPTATAPASALHLAVLRGMIKSLIHPYLTTDIAFDLMEFATMLNALVIHDPMQQTFALRLLKLIPYNDTLTYLACGPAGPLFHVPQGSHRSRTIPSENPLIGQDLAASFADSEDTFNDGDTLVFHDLPDTMTSHLTKVLHQNLLLSPSRLASTLLEAIKSHEESALHRHQQAIITLQRLT